MGVRNQVTAGGRTRAGAGPQLIPCCGKRKMSATCLSVPRCGEVSPGAQVHVARDSHLPSPTTWKASSQHGVAG